MGQFCVQTQVSGTGSPCGVGPATLPAGDIPNLCCSSLQSVGRGQHPLTPCGAPAGSRCSQSLDCRARGHGPALPAFLLGLPTRHGRDVQVHTVHPHQGQRARKKDNAKTNKTAPPRNVSSLMHLPLLSSLPSLPAPASARSGHTQLPFWLWVVYTSLRLLTHPPKVSLWNTQWLPELTARS